MWWKTVPEELEVTVDMVDDPLQVNKNLPRTFGDGFIHVSHIDALVYHDAPMPQMIIPGKRVIGYMDCAVGRKSKIVVSSKVY